MTSFGFALKMERDFPALEGVRGSKFKVYNKLSDYITDYTIIENVTFEKISYLFKIYFLFLFITLIIFIGYLFIYRFLFARFLKFRIFRLKRIVNRYFPYLSNLN